MATLEENLLGVVEKWRFILQRDKSFNGLFISKYIHALVWSSQSPDQNPIKNMGKDLKIYLIECEPLLGKLILKI